MKKLVLILYWIVAILLVATVLTSLGYKLTEAIFIGTAFLPGALAVKYFFPKAKSEDKASTVKNTIFLTLGILTSQIFIVFLAHMFISYVRDRARLFYLAPELPEILMNPIFIAIMIVTMIIGYHFIEQWLDTKYPAEAGPITFLSDRKPVTLKADEILYIESNDSITTVYATDGRSYRNKTPISHWEANLGPGFIRIHRSFLVNRTAVTGADTDTIFIDNRELPVSRKYKDSILLFRESLQES